jgi:hypothetical protein
LRTGKTPGVSNPEQHGADQLEWPAEPPEAKARYLEMLMTGGPARRNRQRKRETRAGSELRALYREAQRKRRANAAAPVKSVRARRKARSKAGRSACRPSPRGAPLPRGHLSRVREEGAQDFGTIPHGVPRVRGGLFQGNRAQGAGLSVRRFCLVPRRG